MGDRAARADLQVCVLGGGISGSVTACLLHDAGVKVALVDQAPELMDRASRWNEGKIHLGYTYTGTDSFASAALMIEGAGTFHQVVEQVCGSPIEAGWMSQPVIYLVDTESLLPVDLLWSRARIVADMLSDKAEQDANLRRYVEGEPLLMRLDPDEASAATRQSNVAAAWQTTERAVAPGPLAAMIRQAITDRGIPIVQDRVLGVTPREPGWTVELDHSEPLAAHAIVNCLGEGRAAVDRPYEHAARRVSIRYKVGLFGTHPTAFKEWAPSTRILGAYGDVTPYGNGDVYLSWYPAGLLGASEDGHPPLLREVPDDEVRRNVVKGLGLEGDLTAQDFEVAGGYIVADGWGEITDLDSPLHRRDTSGARLLRPGLVTVDTGKFSLGPQVASRACQVILRELDTRG